MAMTMTGECQITAPRMTVWKMLNDPDVLRACIPGCEKLNKTSETSFEAVATSKIGPIKARFKGRVELNDLDEPNGYCLSGESNGGIAGFAKGRAKVKLSDSGPNTILAYEVEAQIGGKLAQLGQRLIDGVARRLADQFFVRFTELANTSQGQLSHHTGVLT
jgi:carbon monoxide dehydrogenase subunit G